MDQVSTLPLSTGRSPARPGAAAGPLPAGTTQESSSADSLPDSGEDPESPAGSPAARPTGSAGEGVGPLDPLAEPIAALLGAALAVIALAVPVLVVINDPLLSEPPRSPAEVQARTSGARLVSDTP
jgi:hypothetical protein